MQVRNLCVISTGGESDEASLGFEGAWHQSTEADAQYFWSNFLAFESEGISEVADDMIADKIFGRMRWCKGSGIGKWRDLTTRTWFIPKMLYNLPRVIQRTYRIQVRATLWRMKHCEKISCRVTTVQNTSNPKFEWSLEFKDESYQFQGWKRIDFSRPCRRFKSKPLLFIKSKLTASKWHPSISVLFIQVHPVCEVYDTIQEIRSKASTDGKIYAAECK